MTWLFRLKALCIKIDYTAPSPPIFWDRLVVGNGGGTEKVRNSKDAMQCWKRLG